MSKNTQKEPQTIESVKLVEFKKQSRLYMVIIALVFSVAGFIGGFFASVQVITDTQAKASAIVKELK